MLDNPGIIRSKLKVNAAITTAQKNIEIRSAGINFSDYLWEFVGGAPIQNVWKKFKDAPVKSPESEAL